MGSARAPAGGSRPEFATLTTERLLLRRFDPDDAEDFFAYRTDPAVTRSLPPRRSESADG